jgi:hypothetical protein
MPISLPSISAARPAEPRTKYKTLLSCMYNKKIMLMTIESLSYYHYDKSNALFPPSQPFRKLVLMVERVPYFTKRDFVQHAHPISSLFLTLHKIEI